MSYRKNFAVGEKIRSTDMNVNFSLIQSSLLILGEIPTGSVNGTNTIFTPSSQYVTGKIEVYLVPPPVSDTALITSTTTSLVIASSLGYVRGQQVFFSTGVTGNKTATIIDIPISGTDLTISPTLGSSPVGLIFSILQGGVRKLKTTDYTETPANTSITFVVPPQTGSVPIFNYIKLNP